MKLAWVIQGPFGASSSYYLQAHLFAKRLNDFGHTSHIVHITSIKEDRDDMFREIRNFDADIIITFGDIHFLDLAVNIGIPVISWVLNGSGIAPINKGIPMTSFACSSKYAQSLWKKAGACPTPYLPLAFDSNIFHPGRRDSARARLGWTQTDPTVLMVGTNLPINPQEGELDINLDRKNWRGGLEAFADFLKINPKSKLYVHSNANGAIDLPKLASDLEIKKSVKFTDQSFYTNGVWNKPSSFMADLYRASNVLLFPSLGEGFGLPSIEAQACGIPVVTTDGGPMTELAITGMAVKSTPHPAFPGWRIPNKKSLVEGLIKWININDGWNISLKVQDFSVEAVIEDHFLDILNQTKTLK